MSLLWGLGVEIDPSRSFGERRGRDGWLWGLGIESDSSRSVGERRGDWWVWVRVMAVGWGRP